MPVTVINFYSLTEKTDSVRPGPAAPVIHVTVHNSEAQPTVMTRLLQVVLMAFKFVTCSEMFKFSRNHLLLLQREFGFFFPSPKLWRLLPPAQGLLLLHYRRPPGLLLQKGL
jgi:hypothetical protein